jgi:N-acetylglucosaminyldiphosphoundecaprenol N-acetyl-beta-D-mannosaminyltransferase
MNCTSLDVSAKRNLPSPRPPLANVLGVGVHAVNLAWAADLIETAVEEQRKGYVCVTGVHGVMEAQRDLHFRRALESAMLVVPDGMPTVWVGRAQGLPEMRRVFGPDLMVELSRRSARRGYTAVLYGGKPGVAEELSVNLARWFPSIRVVGTGCPPFRPLTEREEIALQNWFDELNPDLIWVGLSTPKQELFMARYVNRLRCRIMIGVGAAFDIHTGRLSDSPDWTKKAGLQWAHRLYQEPGRLWKRYLVNNSEFLFRITMQLSGATEYRLPDPEVNLDRASLPSRHAELEGRALNYGDD